MNDVGSRTETTSLPCKAGCRAAVPRELESERVCVTHFILAIESGCHEMRRETATGFATPTRRCEIESYVKKAFRCGHQQHQAIERTQEAGPYHTAYLDESSGKP